MAAGHHRRSDDPPGPAGRAPGPARFQVAVRGGVCRRSRQDAAGGGRADHRGRRAGPGGAGRRGQESGRRPRGRRPLRNCGCSHGAGRGRQGAGRHGGGQERGGPGQGGRRRRGPAHREGLFRSKPSFLPVRRTGFHGSGRPRSRPARGQAAALPGRFPGGVRAGLAGSAHRRQLRPQLPGPGVRDLRPGAGAVHQQRARGSGLAEGGGAHRVLHQDRAGGAGRGHPVPGDPAGRRAGHHRRRWRW